MAITGAAFPRMLEKRTADPTTYQRYTQGLYDGMAWLGLAVAVLVSLSAQRLIPLLYGQEYAQSAVILSIQIWAGIAVAMSSVHGRWLLAEGLQKYGRSEEHTSDLQSLMRISYAVFCLKKKIT